MRKIVFFLTLLSFTALFSCRSRKVVPSSSPSPVAEAQQDPYGNKLPGAKVEQVKGGTKVTIDSEVLFEINSSYLSESAKHSLGELFKEIKKQGYKTIVIEGHTDKTGSPEYNKWLSEKRATTVKTLAESHGIDGDRIIKMGYGDSQPVADNKTSEGRAKNRRVEITINTAE